MPDLRDSIAQSLATLADAPLRESARGLLKTLGYASDRTLDIGDSSPRAFLDFVQEHASDSPFNEEKALVGQWTSADLLFQLTDEELAGRRSLFEETDVRPGLLRSYLFFAIDLADGDYSRGRLTAIARQINRVFPMPVMVLIRHQSGGERALSIAVINRRQNKQKADKDVLGKVAIIRDINLATPHRGHLDILNSLALPNLEHPQRQPITSFDALHAAWEQIFNVELLNEKFYRELSNWYFWALPQVQFPADTAAAQEDDEKHRATSLIRLLTRIIFCWFIKEKDLVPEALFNEADLKSVLTDLDPEASTYYQAVLQNLFFATLNTPMGKDRDGRTHRTFALDEGFQKNRDTYGVPTLFRYEDHFQDPDAALDLFADVPFLNGGLFESLDRTDPDTGKRLYVDGFTRNPAKRPYVPNKLFFAPRHRADLSEASGLTSLRNAEVRGLLHILHGYKFTIVENTPIDQEIALDPELLGKVFENLLASYNEETKTTARKQTGSFYTPRSIVEYMVDEALKAHLAKALVAVGMTEESAAIGLGILFAYTEKEHLFMEPEVDALLDAIHTSKILDPACGSGAFPMGVLQKLVYIIHKLDPNNEKWKQLQIDQVADMADPVRRQNTIEDIERDFAENEDDYGRKLYLIENCLYGVDIQPIAIQISKLRFFISLVADQRTNRDKSKNRRVRPLPNLETKFVAADTLRGLPQEGHQLDLVIPEVDAIEAEIELLYHRHFTARTRRKKRGIQNDVQDLRARLTRLLAESLGSKKVAEHVAEWDPFDPQTSADFFDPHWMYGRSLADGFDVVIGNPPYQSAIDHKRTRGAEYRDSIKSSYSSAVGTWDLFIPFFEQSVRLSRTGGVSCLITPNKYLSASYGKGLRKFILENARLDSIIDLSHIRVFESASVYPVITILSHARQNRVYDISLGTVSRPRDEFNIEDYQIVEESSESLGMLPENLWGFLLSPSIKSLKKVISESTSLSQIAKVRATTTAKEADEYGALICEHPCQGWKVLNTGTIDPFTNLWADRPLKHQGRAISKPILPRSSRLSDNRIKQYDSQKIIFAKMALRFEGFVDDQGCFAALNCNSISEPRDGWSLLGLATLLHSDVLHFVYSQYYGGLRMGGGYLPFQAPQLRVVPIPGATQAQKNILSVVGSIVVRSLDTDIASPIQTFFNDLANACVMECYLSEYMAERDLLFHDALAKPLAAYDPDAPEAEQAEVLDHLYRTLNAPDAAVRNRLLRISADSPDLLAVIKEEGRV